MRFGVLLLPVRPWSQGRRLWEEIEELGFDSAWTYDHLTWSGAGEGPWYAAMPTLAAAATATARIRLGTLVASPNFRHPVPFAHEVMSLDDLSEGRFTVGLGAGGVGPDARVLGGEPLTDRERAERFREFVTMLDELLRRPSTTRAGRFHSASGASMRPGCVQRPRVPFAVAATGPLGMRLAARYGETWVTLGDRRRLRDQTPREHLASVRDQVGRLEEACLATGRDPRGLGRLALAGLGRERPLASAEAFREAAGRYREAGITELVVHHPLDGERFAAGPGGLEAVAALLPELRRRAG